MFLILTAWVFLFFIVVNLGWLPRSLARVCSVELPGSMLDHAWLGLFTLVAILQFVSLWSPMDFRVFAAVAAVAGMSGLIRAIFDWRRIWSASLAIPGKLLAIQVMLLIVLAMCSAPPTVGMDTEWYHYGTVMWMNQFPAVPGLANIEPSFGINSSFHLLAAFLNNGIFSNKVDRIIAGFFLALVALECVYRFWSPASPRDIRRVSLVMVILILLKGLTPSENSLESDIAPAMIFCRMILLYLDQAQRSYSMMVLLSSLGLVFKQNFAPILLATGALLVFHSWQDQRKQGQPGLKVIFPVLGMSTVILVGLFIRNTVISGYFLYPLPLKVGEFEWTVPLADVEIFAKGHSVRELFENPLFWLSDHLGRGTLTHPLFVFGIGCLALIVSHKETKDTLKPMLIPIGLALLGTCFIGLTVNTERFAEGFIWVFFASTFILALPIIRGEVWLRRGVVFVFAWMLIGMPAKSIWALEPDWVKFKFANWPYPIFNLPPPAGVPLDEAELTNPDGSRFVFRVPSTVIHNYCKVAPLPCVRTTKVLDRLALRKPGDLRSGFRRMASSQ